MTSPKPKAVKIHLTAQEHEWLLQMVNGFPFPKISGVCKAALRQVFDRGGDLRQIRRLMEADKDISEKARFIAKLSPDDMEAVRKFMRRRREKQRRLSGWLTVAKE